MFQNKTNKYHAAAGEYVRYQAQTLSLLGHRVTCVNYTTYAIGSKPGMCLNNAVPPPEVDIASGRAEESIFFHKNVAQSATFL